MKSILFVQNGDFGEAYRRFAEGGAETYRDHKRSVDFVTSLAPEAKVTTVAFAPRASRSALAPNLRSVCLGRDTLGPAGIARLFDEVAPTHMILRDPHVGFLREAGRRGTQVLPSFADIFSRHGLRGAWRAFVMRRALRRARVPCISNYSLNASRSVVSALRQPADRVVPWDWSHVPLGGVEKAGVADPVRPTAFFAGALTEPKGVGDCLDAVAELRRMGIALSMRFAGPGDLARWTARAEELGLSEQVDFLGAVPNPEIRRLMRAHDFVVVPSRHSYAEGLPNVIYEGLASRSVLIVSDHPAFAGCLVPDAEAAVFPAGDAAALALCVKRLTEDRGRYAAISAASVEAHDRLYVGLEWTELISTFLDDPEDRTGWVGANSLAALDRPGGG